MRPCFTITSDPYLEMGQKPIKPGDKIKFRDRKAMDDDQIYTGTFLGMGPTSTIDNQSILRAAVISVDGVHHPEFVDPAVLVLVK